MLLGAHAETGRAAIARQPPRRIQRGGRTLVVYDTLAAGQDKLIMMTEGAEAAQPFRPEIKPIDAYNSGILDRIDLADESAESNRVSPPW